MPVKYIVNKNQSSSAAQNCIKIDNTEVIASYANSSS